MRIIIIFFILCLLLVACFGDRSAPKPKELHCEPLRTLMGGDFKMSVYKNDIPDVVIDSLHKPEGRFRIGDIRDTGNINLTDAFIIGDTAYSRIMEYALINDTNCLLVYRQGGLGVHYVVELIRYKGNFSRDSYISTVVKDTSVLLDFFKTKGKINCALR